MPSSVLEAGGAELAEGTQDWRQLKSWSCHLPTGTFGNLLERSEPRFPHLSYGDYGGFTTLVTGSDEKFPGKLSVPWKTPANVGYP